MLLVLGISLALFSLASLALAANCRFRMQNRQMLIDLRERASRLRIQAMENDSEIKPQIHADRDENSATLTQ